MLLMVLIAVDGGDNRQWSQSVGVTPHRPSAEQQSCTMAASRDEAKAREAKMIRVSRDMAGGGLLSEVPAFGRPARAQKSFLITGPFVQDSSKKWAKRSEGMTRLTSTLRGEPLRGDLVISLGRRRG